MKYILFFKIDRERSFSVGKRQTAWLMAALLGIHAVCGNAFAAEADTALSENKKTIVRDLEAYDKLEVLALFENGDLEVYSCASEEDLEKRIDTLAGMHDVSVVQPNYSYEAQALSVSDASVSEQWALYNDGSFTIEEEKNRYPVYDDPFGRPAAPGTWHRVVRKTDLVGVLVEVARVKATAGIDINISGAWEKYGNGSHDVIVAMIDTGIDISHEDLTDAIWVNTDEIPGNGIDDDGNGYVDDVNGWNFYHNNNQVFTGDEDSHGTHGAGTIRASIGNGLGIAGIVPGTRVRVMPVKALGGQDGGGSTASLIRAIRYAEDNGASICNLSLTSTTDDRALFQAMAGSTMLFVVAAGNGDSTTGKGVNTDETPFYPAAYDLDNLISVANLTCDGNLHESSNYGASTVDLAAPGAYILSTTPGNTYSYMSGTSMAAPMVTGAAAMVYSYFDGIGLADVKEILLSTVTPLESLSGKTVTGGMLNVGAALEYDINALSRRGFEKGGAAPENGNAPYIEAKSRRSFDGVYLTVRVVDVDGDLDTMLYAEGECSREQFAEGSVGTPFTVSEKDTAMFRIGYTGTYSFYARDRRGNDTVYVVKMANMSDGPGALD